MSDRARPIDSYDAALDGTASFFQHHGVWAPGVRLFRQLGFGAKSAMITAAFAIPLGVLSWGFFDANQRSIAFSAAERVGVAYLEALLPDLDAAQDARGATMRGERAPMAASTALEAAQREHGEALGTEAQWKAVQSTRASLGALAADAHAESRFAAHGAHVAALLELVSQASDGSNLTLDPDVDTYYMMDAATSRTLQLVESLAQLGDTALVVAATGSASPPQHARIDRLAVVAESQLVGLERAIAKVLVPRPDLAKALRLDAAAEATRKAIATASAAHEADVAVRDAARLAREVREAVAALRAAQRAQLGALDAAIAVRIGGFKGERNRTAVLVVVALMLGGYLFRAFFLATRGGLLEVGAHIDAMARGDLTRSPKPWGRDEAAQLMATLATTQDALRRIVTEVRAGADAIVGASTEISAGALDLSSRTEQTGAALEESAASMEQISSTVRSTADHARKGAEIASGNAEVARRGGNVIDDVVRTMEEIQQASTRIASIVSVIDGIAFQTNILALNAAVEAARAGEHGRGFAVVAAEVRALSQRSAEAAREIRGLIDATVRKVGDGATVVRSAGDTMRALVGNAEELESLSTAIADAASQQDGGVSQVGQAIQELDRGAQQNAALVEQTAAAAGQLKHQATALVGTVAVFRLPQAVR
jgi:methyl-accepting chemotaxis protein